MIINGTYTNATVFTSPNAETAIDDYAIAQIKMLCDNEVSKDCRIRIMPDVHPGTVGPIGFTMTVGNRVIPSIVGIDIGCGIALTKIKQTKVEFQKLDTVIRENIPSGFSVRKKPHHLSTAFDFTKLYCYKNIQKEKAQASLGSLGGGNHFIELDKDENNALYVVIHSGSRHLGKEVSEHYQLLGQKALKEQGIQVPYELTYLEDKLMDCYLHDIQIVQEFAARNREVILDELVKGMKWKIQESYSCCHNYIENIGNIQILRKGAISAKKNETVIIPVNMRDGIILGSGLGNEDWNYSSPHGSGRILKREDVKKGFTVSSFKAEMKGIYSSCINKSTLDEAPFAYHCMEDITQAIAETVQIEKIMKPVYNFKAGN